MTLDDARRLALSLPDATEAPHHEATSFRVDGRIFASAPPDGLHLHIFVQEQERERAVASHPDAFSPLRWGPRIVGVRAIVAKAPPAVLTALLESAWERAATPPRRARGDAARQRDDEA